MSVERRLEKEQQKPIGILVEMKKELRKKYLSPTFRDHIVD